MNKSAVAQYHVMQTAKWFQSRAQRCGPVAHAGERTREFARTTSALNIQLLAAGFNLDASIIKARNVRYNVGMKFRKLRIAWSVICGIVCLLLVLLWVRSYWWIDHLQHVSTTFFSDTCPYDGKLVFNWSYPNVTESAMARRGKRWRLWAQSVESWRGNTAPPLRKRLFQPFSLTLNPNQLVIPLWSLVLLSLTLFALPWLQNLRRRVRLRGVLNSTTISSFSLTDLLLATALVAIGITMVATPFTYPPPPGQRPWQGAFPVIILWFSGGALIGAGFFAPFHRIKAGVALGVATATLALLLTLCCL